MESTDWDRAYRGDRPPAWSIGEPQPELAALLDRPGTVRSEVLDAGCGYGELTLAIAARGHTVVGMDVSETALSAAVAAAETRGLTAQFVTADVTELTGYDGRFTTIVDSGLLHALPAERRDDYLAAMSRAAAPGAQLHVLAFAADAFPAAGGEGPARFSAAGLRAVLGRHWQVGEIRTAYLQSAATRLPDGSAPPAAATDERGRLTIPGLLATAHKPG